MLAECDQETDKMGYIYVTETEKGEEEVGGGGTGREKSTKVSGMYMF